MIRPGQVWQNTEDGELVTVKQVKDGDVFVESMDGREASKRRVETILRHYVQI